MEGDRRSHEFTLDILLDQDILAARLKPECFGSCHEGGPWRAGHRDFNMAVHCRQVAMLENIISAQPPNSACSKDYRARGNEQ